MLLTLRHVKKNNSK